MLRTALMLLVFLTTSGAIGQPATPGSTVPNEAATTSTLGKYTGRVTERGGKRWSDFDLDLSQSPGSITMFRANRACRHEPIAVTSLKDGILRLESKGNVTDCGNRVFELTTSGDELTGTMKVYDRVFDVKATKK